MKKSKKFAVGILVGIAVIAIALLIGNNILEKKIKKSLEDNLKRANTSFEKVDVKLLDRKAEVIKPFVELKGKTLKVDTILLNDIKLWDYITKKDIIIGNLVIANPTAKFYKLSDKPKDTTEKKKKSKFKNRILIKKVKVTKGDFRIFEKDSSEHRLFASVRSINMENVRINAKTLKETVPFNYDLILLDADSLFYDLDKQHELALGNFRLDNNQVSISDFRIIPKYSKSGHQKTTPIEKDRYDLTIDSINMSNLNWTVQNDSLKIQNPYTEISSANFKIYRDKLQPDDTSIKPLYSKMLRKMPVLLQLDSINIKNAYIRYEENIKEDRGPGMIEFSNLNVDIQNITNINLDREDFPETKITANADFMGAAPLSVNWSFNISNKSDRFQISGEMGNLAAEQMNKFMKPAMNVEANGEILDMYFNFTGNDNQASGDMRLEYKDFKIEVLQKDGQKKNKVVSAIANLFVKNKALNEKANYKEISFTRDKTKSFWNYFWNLIKNGALKAFL